MLVRILFIFAFVAILSLSRKTSFVQKNCAIQKINWIVTEFGKEHFYKKVTGFKCNINKINSTFSFDIQKDKSIVDGLRDAKDTNNITIVELNWQKGRKFNISNLLSFLFNYCPNYIIILFVNLNSIELNFSVLDRTTLITSIYLINSNLRFTIDGKSVQICPDIISSGMNISSIFNLPTIETNFDSKYLALFKCRFPFTICPLVFKNTNLIFIELFDLTDTFYKTNLMRFSNETFDDLNSTISKINIISCENLALDTRLLHPSVFRYLHSIAFMCFVSSINRDVFTRLKYLEIIEFRTTFFRKLIHRDGIEWIKGINRGVHLDLSNLTNIAYFEKVSKHVRLSAWSDEVNLGISHVFPEEDFCIYKDYPFDQMVFTFQKCEFCTNDELSEHIHHLNPSYSCTYLWLIQYYYLLSNYFYPDSETHKNDWLMIYNSVSYKNRNNCNFQRRLAICNRSDYHIKDIWGAYDYFIINKKIQISVKILTYLFSLFSITTNILVIRIIFAKHNNQVFKDFKHYTYLGLISVFSLCISLIEIFSWLSECFYPFKVFCLGVHKTVVAQLFKMVVKECIVTALRFMSNFCYLAFSLNRISLIGQNHGPLIQFAAKMTLWKYISYSLLTSLVFSWVKYFKYTINFDRDELNFPIWNELDIATPNSILPRIMDVYTIFNVISDLLNYLVFVILCFLVDIKMLLKLKSTVNESINRIKAISNEKQFEKKKNELEDTMNKSIRMVVLNTTIGLLFKCPMVFLPLVNTIAEFFYKNMKMRSKHPSFDQFYTQLFDTNTYSLIQDSTEFLFLISLSIQYFIYKKFDNKFKIASISSPKIKKK